MFFIASAIHSCYNLFDIKMFFSCMQNWEGQGKTSYASLCWNSNNSTFKVKAVFLSRLEFCFAKNTSSTQRGRVILKRFDKYLFIMKSHSKFSNNKNRCMWQTFCRILLQYDVSCKTNNFPYSTSTASSLFSYSA